MKLSLYLSLIALATVATSVLPASAQEGGRAPGARFNFAPNTWKQESSPARNAMPDPAHTVRSGMVPGGNPLGLDPLLLAKPPAPLPKLTPIIASQPATTSLTPSMRIPNTSFKPMFGKPMETSPLSAFPQKMAQLPVPQQAVPVAAKSAPVAVAHTSRSRGVSGRVKPWAHTEPTSASPGVASYGNGVGYVPGAYLPSTASSGGGASTRLSGVILTKKHH